MTFLCGQNARTTMKKRMPASGGFSVVGLHGRFLCLTMSYMKETFTIRIPAKLRRELEQLAKRTRRPASEIAREALRRYMAAERFRVLREKTLPLAEAQGILTDEDVFRIVS